MQLAFLYNKDGDTPKASAMLDEGLRYRPNSPNIWLARANILYGDEQLDLARAAYLKVMQVTEPAAGQAVPAGAPTRLRATAAYQLALMDISANNFVEAEHYARMALSLNFNGVGYHSVLSRVPARRGPGRRKPTPKTRWKCACGWRNRRTIKPIIRERMRRQLTVRFTSE